MNKKSVMIFFVMIIKINTIYGWFGSDLLKDAKNVVHNKENAFKKSVSNLKQDLHAGVWDTLTTFTASFPSMNGYLYGIKDMVMTLILKNKTRITIPFIKNGNFVKYKSKIKNGNFVKYESKIKNKKSVSIKSLFKEAADADQLQFSMTYLNGDLHLTVTGDGFASGQESLVIPLKAVDPKLKKVPSSLEDISEYKLVINGSIHHRNFPGSFVLPIAQ